MIIVLSPAKSLDYDTPPHVRKHTLPEFVDDAAELIAQLRTLSPQQIGTLMHISDPLAQLNYIRYGDWSPARFASPHAKQAMLAFNGDVYEGFDARSLSAADLDYAQGHVRVLSGLYGVLRPLDLMQPYRLEMGTRLENPRGKDLYAFWGDKITAALNEQLKKTRGARVLVNGASDEYFRSVRPRQLDAPVITPVFEDWKNGRYKIISFYAKRARGLFARFAVVNRIDEPAKLAAFDVGGYQFDANASNDSTPAVMAHAARHWARRMPLVIGCRLDAA
ncbi:hypothetical protein DFQ28_000220 [Apophysomyces sp. BC1034]|nr:hypothetical protein DFQ28_000220 [Apophysomyces sp. BC1034]